MLISRSLLISQYLGSFLPHLRSCGLFATIVRKLFHSFRSKNCKLSQYLLSKHLSLFWTHAILIKLLYKRKAHLVYVFVKHDKVPGRDALLLRGLPLVRRFVRVWNRSFHFLLHQVHQVAQELLLLRLWTTYAQENKIFFK